MNQKTKAWIIALTVAASIIGGIMAYDSWKIQSYGPRIDHVRPADQGCSLWGNPAQPACGGGGSGGTGVHGVVYM